MVYFYYNLQSICLPTSCSENSPLIFRFVMSLCEARNSTTFPFSFLMGTMSNKHQNGDPEIKSQGKRIEIIKKHIHVNDMSHKSELEPHVCTFICVGAGNPLSVTIQMKATQQFYPVLLLVVM